MLSELMQCSMKARPIYSQPAQAISHRINTEARYKAAFNGKEQSAYDLCAKMGKSYSAVFLMLYKLEKSGKVKRNRIIQTKGKPRIMWKWCENVLD